MAWTSRGWPLLPGDVLGRFEIVREVGRGGFVDSGFAAQVSAETIAGGLRYGSTALTLEASA